MGPPSRINSAWPIWAAMLASSTAAPAGDAGPREPRVVTAKMVAYAVVARPDAIYFSAPDGLHVRPRAPARARPRRFGPAEGMRDSAIIVDDRFVYSLSDGKLWRSPIPGRGPAGARPQALADVGATVALAGDTDALYFPAEDSAQVFRLARAGGAPVPLVRSGAEPPTLTSSQREPQGIVVDDGAVYWTFEGKLLRVDKSGGAARVLTRAPKLVGPSLAVDGDLVYWGQGGKTYRARKRDGGETRAILDVEAQMIRARGDTLFLLGDHDLLRVPRDGGVPEPLDDCPLPKTAFDVAGGALVWSDEGTGFAQPGIFELDLTPATGTAATHRPRGKLDRDEAARAARAWLTELAAPQGRPALQAPLHVRLERGLGDDDFVLDRDVRAAADLRDLGAELRARHHELLTFTARCPSWEPASPRVRRAIDRAGRAATAAAPDEIVIVNHRNAQCPFAEVIARMKRVGDAVVPTSLLYRTGYDCE